MRRISSVLVIPRFAAETQSKRRHSHHHPETLKVRSQSPKVRSSQSPLVKLDKTLDEEEDMASFLGGLVEGTNEVTLEEMSPRDTKEKKKVQDAPDFLQATNETALKMKCQWLERELCELQERTRVALEESWAEAQRAREEGRTKKEKVDKLEAKLSRLRMASTSRWEEQQRSHAMGKRCSSVPELPRLEARALAEARRRRSQQQQQQSLPRNLQKTFLGFSQSISSIGSGSGPFSHAASKLKRSRTCVAICELNEASFSSQQQQLPRTSLFARTSWGSDGSRESSSSFDFQDPFQRTNGPPSRNHSRPQDEGGNPLSLPKTKLRRHHSLAAGWPVSNSGPPPRRRSFLDNLDNVARGLGNLFLNTGGVTENPRPRRSQLSHRLVELHQEKAQKTHNLRLYLKNRTMAEEVLRGAVEFQGGVIEDLRGDCDNAREKLEQTRERNKMKRGCLVIELVRLLDRVRHKERELRHFLLE